MGIILCWRGCLPFLCWEVLRGCLLAYFVLGGVARLPPHPCNTSSGYDLAKDDALIQRLRAAPLVRVVRCVSSPEQ